MKINPLANFAYFTAIAVRIRIAAFGIAKSEVDYTICEFDLNNSLEWRRVIPY